MTNKALLVALFLLVAVSPSFGETHQIGLNGEIYTVFSGPLNAFEDSPEFDPWVIALEVTQPNGESSIAVVPGSEGASPENTPGLEWVDESGRLILTWLSEEQGLLKLHVSEYSIGVFRTVLGEGDNEFAFENSPKAHWTHASPSTANSMSQVSVLHIFWRDDLGEALYDPLVLVDGQYFGDRQRVSISALFDRIENPRPGMDFLNETLWVVSGEDSTSTLVAVADPVNGRISTARVKLVPEELVALADLGRQVIIVDGGTGDPETSLGDIVPIAVEQSMILHPSILEGIADRLQVVLEPFNWEDPSHALQASDLARAVIIAEGITADDGGVYRPIDPDQTLIIELTKESNLEEPSHFFEVTTIREFSLPDMPENAEIFVSSQGDHLAIAWPENGGVAWIKDSGDGWVQNLMIPVGFGLSLEEAFHLIERQTRHR